MDHGNGADSGFPQRQKRSAALTVRAPDPQLVEDGIVFINPLIGVAVQFGQFPETGAA